MVPVVPRHLVESLNDVLVANFDGELSAEQYRTLVASFDDEPGGWKRCGLAFLEAQALGLELDDIRRSLDVRESGSATGGVVRWNATAWEKARMLLAVAASFLGSR